MSTFVVFEDSGWKDLYPITLSRPTFDCRCGSTTLGRRLMAQAREAEEGITSFITRPLLTEWTKRAYPGHHVNQSHGGETVFLNGRLLCLKDGFQELLTLASKGVVVIDGVVAAARLDNIASPTYFEDLRYALESKEPAPVPKGQPVIHPADNVRLASYPWDLVHWNHAVIEDDYIWASRHPHPATPHLNPGAQLIKKDHMIIRGDVDVEPGAILDARNGPIILGEGVRIGHQALVEGPAYLGPGTAVNAQARLYDGVSAGSTCKLGGEIEASVIQGFTNKQHDGFLGHSFLGEWVNLGAGTTNSDLKNNYGPVRVWTPEGERDTGHLFVGLLMGDHSKTAIGTRLNTGTTVGFSANIFSSGFPPKHVPSFTWMGDDGASAYQLEKALEVARKVVERRKIAFEPIDELIFQTIARGGE